MRQIKNSLKLIVLANTVPLIIAVTAFGVDSATNIQFSKQELLIMFAAGTIIAVGIAEYLSRKALKAVNTEILEALKTSTNNKKEEISIEKAKTLLTEFQTITQKIEEINKEEEKKLKEIQSRVELIVEQAAESLESAKKKVLDFKESLKEKECNVEK